MDKLTKEKLSTTSVPVETVLAALKVLATMKWNTIIKVFESQDTTSKIIEGEILLDDVLKIVGVGVPPVAIIANDLELAIDAEQVALVVTSIITQIPSVNNFIQDINKPRVLANNEYLVWNHVFER